MLSYVMFLLCYVYVTLYSMFCFLLRYITYLADGVHLNPSGQYHLYRSYRGAILKGLSFL